ncbi:hypothetical protein HYH03_002398 [Edaphochlamys debaryana]|uniref:Peptidase M11 gametolysin domain-containing protein n=1 Tax=Edaphochlamys debaryana TaxID=47281 RepID=A0A836C3T8_9CHLO|nr:hypothetical protein HYH03_002398 [Edaphochlamys debaryana]|eukprot:KAG2499451.1 hypothetical protein HYH03_002398 [Edaphochlamys debaryana]
MAPRLGFFVASALALCALATGAAPPPSPPSPPHAAVLGGRLILKDSHKGPGAVRWSLLKADGEAIRLPGRPTTETGEALDAGARISLSCRFVPGSRYACAAVSNVRVTKLAAPLVAAGVTLRTLTIVTSLSGSCTRAGASVAAVQTALLGPDGFAAFFRNCSYGNMLIDTKRSKAPILACNEDALATVATRAARAKLGKGALDEYTHLSFVLPRGMLGACGWLGFAELPGSRTWFSADTEKKTGWKGIFSKGTYMQELLHNFGLYHGWANGIEYNDLTTSMGSADVCPSAPELSRLGWARPVAELAAASLPAGEVREFSLPPTYLSDVNHLRIQTDWLGDDYNKNVFVALRVARGGDVELGPKFDRKVSVHEIGRRIDNSFRAQGDPRVSVIGAIGEGQYTVFQDYSLVVRTEHLNPDATLATVGLCRYAASPAECAPLLRGAATPEAPPEAMEPPLYPPIGDYAPPPVDMPPFGDYAPPPYDEPPVDYWPPPPY